ncbi:hypothetical protein ENC19_13120 [Verrucosispora sp. CWR15]|uniref:Uncharacterized protein n=1 Tax=Verrucosispora sioxanthis TaxID=2499994 RepID=A0A6M1L7E7_9ACTN|nr:hypothetical protein [Verrucosispora sioxanthis]NEE64423.1 hypothetical protein [Verrucosispora sioxanthis]NGM13533.1 hypothetical protein [Verrucosispora sioxanthis]
MTARVADHTPWCGRDHRCGLGEHRSPEIVIDLPGHARAVLVRVRTAAGREHAEVRVRVALAPGEPAARRQLAELLADLRHTVTRAAVTARPRPRKATR